MATSPVEIEQTTDRKPRSVENRPRSRPHPILKWILALLVVVLAAGAGYGVWRNYFFGRESTDDAQIDGHVNPVNAKVGGTVLSVFVKDNQPVQAGVVVAQLDSRDYEIAVARAQADLADAEASALGARAEVPITSAASGSQLSAAEATMMRAKGGVEAAEKDLVVAGARLALTQARVREAQPNYSKALRDLERMKPLISKDEISQQQYDAAVTAVDLARAVVESLQAAVAEAEGGIAAAQGRLSQARGVVAQAQAEVEATKTAPQLLAVTKAKAQSAEARIEQAKAVLAQAQLHLGRVTIKAPVAGVVSRKTVEVGQTVQPGQPLLAVVPLDEVWVVANFKETQLAQMHSGQAAVVFVDAFGGRKYSAHVESIASATGAKFSLLPPENATGNYVKVVQRVPVKIVLDQGQDPEHLLRPGMSVTVTVTIL